MMNMDQYCLYTRRISFSAIAFLLVVWQTDSILATETNDCSTCYSFQTVERYWEESNNYCKQMKGNLVSMETEEEYQFINKTIQSLDISGNEWYIGLKKNRTGDWKWTSGHSLTIDKWLPGQPRNDGDCVKMIKDYKGLGLFDDVKCNGYKMFICEYHEVQAACTSINKKFCLSRAKPPSTKETTQRTHSYSSATQSTTTISSSTELEQQTKIFIRPTTKAKGDANNYQPGSSPFPLVIVTVSLGLVLAVSACLLVFMCYWKRRNKGDKKEKPRSETTGLPSDALEQSSKNQGPEDGGFAEGVNNVQLFNQNGDHPYVAYAVIHNNLTHQNQGSAVSKEPTYASIQDENTIERSFQKNCPNDHAMPTATMSAEDSGSSAGMEKSQTEAVYSSIDESKKDDGSDGKTWSANQQVVYASVDKSAKKSKPWTSEDAVYAEVGSKDNSVEQQPSKITYAELADFTNNAPEEAVKPAPCQSAEYAVIIGQKT